MLQKTLLARVSLPSGTFLKTWKDITFNGFTKTLNGGPGECVIQYAVPFDYDGADLREGNDVELVIADKDTMVPSNDQFGTRTIYKGYVSLIERNIDAASETVTVHLLGYYTLLALDVLKDGSQTVLYSHDESPAGLTTNSVDQNSADIGTMVRAVVDRFNLENTPGRIFYEASDIPDSGTAVTYSFIQQTYREAIDVLKEMAPPNVYWYVDERGRMTFKEVPSTPTHTFALGRHISNVRVERSLETVRNVVLLTYAASEGASYKHYEDSSSIGRYGRRTERIFDEGLIETDAADAAGAKFLAENAEPSTKLTATIIDNNSSDDMRGMDIEDIQPGHTCRFVSFSSTLSDIFRDNMLITSVTYSLGAVQIEVEVIKSGLLDLQAKQGKQIGNITKLFTPQSYS